MPIPPDTAAAPPTREGSRITVTTTESTASSAYWESLWVEGRQYRQPCDAETQLMDQHLGPGRGRSALDIGCGAGNLTRHVHHKLGYRTTGVDFAASALALAATKDTDAGSEPEWRHLDVTTDDLTALPDPAYALITCRLVYRWIDSKPAFINRVRHLLAPGGTFWVVTEVAGRSPTTNPTHQGRGITPADAELLTAGWSSVRTADLDVLRCYALRP